MRPSPILAGAGASALLDTLLSLCGLYREPTMRLELSGPLLKRLTGMRRSVFRESGPDTSKRMVGVRGCPEIAHLVVAGVLARVRQPAEDTAAA